MQRWVGIDEAGYGPNLGPLVMTAVVATATRGHPPYHPHPDFWKDLLPHVSRVGGNAALLWIDDSKKIYRGAGGRERIDAACSLVIEETGKPTPGSVGGLLQALEAGGLAECELDCWLPERSNDVSWPGPASAEMIAKLRPLKPLSPIGSAWRITDVRTMVMGPSWFNASLTRTGTKATAHFEAFSRLLRPIRDMTREGDSTSVSCDKHGGRHFYLEHLRTVFSDEWIERGPEGPALSRYLVRGENRSLDLSFAPRADSDNGLVALASLVSKAVRESWMDAFNAFWKARIPGLKSTAGYPVDATRFRRQIEAIAVEMGLEPRSWWREK